MCDELRCFNCKNCKGKKLYESYEKIEYYLIKILIVMDNSNNYIFAIYASADFLDYHDFYLLKIIINENIDPNDDFRWIENMRDALSYYSDIHHCWKKSGKQFFSCANPLKDNWKRVWWYGECHPPFIGELIAVGTDVKIEYNSCIPLLHNFMFNYNYYEYEKKVVDEIHFELYLCICYENDYVSMCDIIITLLKKYNYIEWRLPYVRSDDELL